MKFTDIFIKRPVLAMCISIMLIVMGLQAAFKLQVREYPELVNTVVTVTTVYPGADAQTMQAFVTSTLEESIAQADNIDYITSSSAANVSRINVKMRLNTVPGIAVADIAAKVNAVRSRLPSSIEDPTVSATSGAMEAILFVRFTSDTLSAPQITDYVERVVKPQLFTVNGVSQVNLFGGANFGLRVWLDPDKMASLGLSAPAVISALSSNNVQTAAGNINGYYTVYANKVESTARNVDELANLVVKTTASGQQIKLKEVARIELDKSNDSSRALVNGADAVVLAIEAASNANALTVAKNLYPVIEQIQANLPSSLESEIMYDKTIAIHSAIYEVVKTILEATVIVLVVITLFLGSLRAMIIPIVTIPISLIGVIMLLQGFGFSLNLLTLLGLILAIGLVVDDAIVVLENIDRHIKEGETPFRAAIIGSREIALPVIAMTLTLMVVYSPMALMGGITGTLFQEFALTLAGAVFISGIAALTLSPMMSSRILIRETTPNRLARCVDGFLTKMTNCYGNMLMLVMSMRKTMLLFVLLIFSSLPFLFKYLPSELAPTEDRGIVVAIATGPANVNLDYVQEVMTPFAQKTQELPEVSATQIMPGFPAANGAFSLIPLVDWRERTRSQAEVMAEVSQLANQVPEMSVITFAFPEISTGEGGLPFSFVITTANDYRQLAEVAEMFLSAAQRSGKFFFTMLDLKFDTAAMRLRLDREKLGAYGVSVQQVSATLGSYLSGATLSRVEIDSRPYSIVSQVERKNRLNPQDLGNYFVTASNGTSIPLSAFMTMELETRPASLARMNQLNSATISGVISGSMGDTIQWAEATAKEILPAGYQYDFLSEARQYKQEGNTLLLTFLLAVVMIYLVLAIQFESWRDALVILISVPLAISGALLTLNLLGFMRVPGTSLNLYSQVGLLTLVGLITKHGILMCEVAKEAQLHQGKSRYEAIVYAAQLRLRPILMTTAAMVAGVVPLLFASGAGAVMRFSIGVVIASGLTIGTLFTLFVLPVIYTFIASEHKPLMAFDETPHKN